MKMIETIGIKCTILFELCLSVFLVLGTSYAEEGKCPMKVEIINKDQARYDTPENAFVALCSALIKEDLEWSDETLTEESAEEQKRLFKEAGIDPRKIFEIEKHVKDTFIINKIDYKDAVLLVIKYYVKDGTIMKIPATFVKEGEKWKSTNKFAADEELQDYMDFFPVLFDGKGQRPADVNTFLSYANPLQMKTELPMGTTKFLLHIFYGQTIDPATFKAELNRQDISAQFEPKPVGDQVVELNLKKGRNVLLVSIQDKRKDGKTAKDIDRLVFIVP